MMQGIIVGMKRALDIVERSEGDMDFAVFAIKRDIEGLEKEAGQEASDEQGL